MQSSKNEKRLRIAFLGAGRVAQHYDKMLRLKELSGFELVGICDTNIVAAQKLSEAWKTEPYSDLEVMIEHANPELVLVLTPSGMHYEHAKLILLHGVNVLVEKPMTMLPSQALDLDLIATSRGLMLGVVFQNRFNPSIVKLKEALQQNRFGKIITATIRLRWCREQSYYMDGWHGTWEFDGGVINQQAIHHVDALNWLLGPITTVSATMAKRMNKLEAEDTLVAIFRLENGALGTIEATTAARPRDFEASLSVVGEKGTCVIGGIALNEVITWEFIDSIKDDETVKNEFSQEVPTGYGLSHAYVLNNTFERLNNGIKDPLVSTASSIATSELIHAIYASIEKECWINVADKIESQRLGKKDKK
jgi:UDP-N-acetyl-2-amino-2-deoxyglucuronate dehydrogenase